MITVRLPTPSAVGREPSRLLTPRLLTVSGTKADWTPTAVKQIEPTVFTPIGAFVQLFCKVTNHWAPGCGVMNPVHHPSVLSTTLVKCPAGACNVKFTVDAGELSAIPSETQAMFCVRTTG